MSGARGPIRLLLLILLLGLAAPARAVMVTYTANLSTSKGNPVTDLLILESDGVHPVQASVYPADVPGHGTAVISHDALYQPVRSLLIGLTDGQDDNGNAKVQIVMFLDPAFAAAHAGVPFSSVFPGTRHSDTITRLMAAVAGDATQLAWFTDTFFPGPAADAAFATAGPFAVAEFTSLKVIGQEATAGEWMVTSFASLSAGNPNAQSGKVTAVIGETAKIDRGPFDVEMTVDGDGVFAVDKTVVNNTGFPWRRFVMELGTGVGGAFVRSTGGDGLGFDASQNDREESGAFPMVTVSEDRIVFDGALAPGGSAHFVVFVSTNTIGNHLVTIRQLAPEATAPVPVLQPWGLALLIAALAGLAAARLQRRAALRRRRAYACASPTAAQ
jgi:hypothetical protein